MKVLDKPKITHDKYENGDKRLSLISLILRSMILWHIFSTVTKNRCLTTWLHPIRTPFLLAFIFLCKWKVYLGAHAMKFSFKDVTHVIDVTHP